MMIHNTQSIGTKYISQYILSAHSCTQFRWVEITPHLGSNRSYSM